MTERRRGKYVWVSWLSKLMAGETSCEWAPWFKTNFTKYEKVPSDFDLTKWQIEHTRMLRELRAEREAAGERVLMERANQFRFRPESGLVISGKPDLIALSSEAVTIYDCKTGQPRTSDQIQIMLYMHCLPRSIADFEESQPKGCVVYKTEKVEIPAEVINEEFEENFKYFLGILTSDDEPIKVPCQAECRFCDITTADCPERMA